MKLLVCRVQVDNAFVHRVITLELLQFLVKCLLRNRFGVVPSGLWFAVRTLYFLVCGYLGQILIIANGLKVHNLDLGHGLE